MTRFILLSLFFTTGNYTDQVHTYIVALYRKQLMMRFVLLVLIFSSRCSLPQATDKGSYFRCFSDTISHCSNLMHCCRPELTIVVCVCLSRLNYCNSPLASCLMYLLSKLQNVQNNTANL